MSVYLQDPDVTLYHGDVLDVLRELPDESVDCAATSPPFYGLRKYLDDDHPDKASEIGLEATPEEWRDRLVEVFREVRRVLVPTGTLWVECGDSYTAGHSDWSRWKGGQTFKEERRPSLHPYKPKDLLGTPWLLAFALRADGWWLRGCNIWAKPNAMPESAKDRCTTAHSYVFQLSKSARYFFDAEAVRESAEYGRRNWNGATPHETYDAGRAGMRLTQSTTGSDPDSGKHPRSVWTIPTQGYPEAHFATWPEALARRIILAGCPADGTILDPFVGSGTTCLVARKHGRRSIGIDLNAEYLALAARRLAQQSLLAVEA